VVEAAVMERSAGGSVARWPTALLIVPLLGVLALLIISGQWPQLRSRIAFAPRGLVAVAPGEVHRVEIRAGRDVLALLRRANGWSFEGGDGAVPSELAAHVETALRLINVSEAVREIPASELTPASFAEFGLDPPAIAAVLETSRGVAATANFGVLNPASTAHYVRLAGRPAVDLVPRHVGEEWRVTFDMARRLRGQIAPSAIARGKSLLLPVSMARVWAIEIVYAGKLTRFERDSGGNWFRHLGQHSHAPATAEHVADAAQARVIEAALQGFDATAVERRIGPAEPSQLARYGLNLPSLILLVYARDSSAPLARLEYGAAADGFGRYARLAPDGAVVTIAEFEMRRLTELLRAVGAGT
jgi:hypothetical protein